MRAGAASDEALAAFLVEELAIGDAEDAVAALRSQLSVPARLPADEYEMLFEAVAAMQKDLVRRRRPAPVLEHLCVYWMRAVCALRAAGDGILY